MELLLALGCLGLAAVMLYPGSKTLQRQYYRQQLRYTSIYFGCGYQTDAAADAVSVGKLYVHA